MKKEITVERALEFIKMCEKFGFDENNLLPGYSVKDFKDKMYRCKKVISNAMSV